MLIGLPSAFDPKMPNGGDGWLDGAGIAMHNDLVVLYLREISIEPSKTLST